MGLSQKTKAWLFLGQHSWIAMGVGYLWVVISFFLDFEFPSSGAILGSSALVAELFFSRFEWKEEALNYERGTRLTWYWNSEIEQYSYQGTHHFLHSNQVASLSHRHIQTKDNKKPKVNGFDELRTIALPAHFSENEHGERVWLIRKTVDQFDRNIAIAIAFTAVFGAVIWGYGHLLDRPCLCL